MFSCWPIQDPVEYSKVRSSSFHKKRFRCFFVSLLMNHLEVLRAIMMAMLLTTVMVWVGMPSTCFSTLLVFFGIANDTNLFRANMSTVHLQPIISLTSFTPFSPQIAYPLQISPQTAYPLQASPAQCSKLWLSGISSTYGGRGVGVAATVLVVAAGQVQYLARWLTSGSLWGVAAQQQKLIRRSRTTWKIGKKLSHFLRQLASQLPFSWTISSAAASFFDN